MHVPVMLDEALEYLAIRPAGVYLDCTAGMGGHTGAIAARLGEGFVIANDRDPESLELARQNTAQWADRIRYQRGRFGELGRTLKEQGVEKVDGLLADLGVSRFQLTSGHRGFSLTADGPVDMRMDPSHGEPANEIVNFSSERELADLIFQYGNERRSRRIARAIVRARPIHSTLQLARVVEEAVPRTTRLHPATQTFLALRLVVNDEPGELRSLLEQAPELVKSGGRVVVISFMSLEDREVKQSFQSLGRAGRARILTRHVVVPTERETEANPPSRSAKLRALEMV